MANKVLNKAQLDSLRRVLTEKKLLPCDCAGIYLDPTPSLIAGDLDGKYDMYKIVFVKGELEQMVGFPVAENKWDVDEVKEQLTKCFCKKGGDGVGGGDGK